VSDFSKPCRPFVFISLFILCYFFYFFLLRFVCVFSFTYVCMLRLLHSCEIKNNCANCVIYDIRVRIPWFEIFALTVTVLRSQLRVGMDWRPRRVDPVKWPWSNSMKQDCNCTDTYTCRPTCTMSLKRLYEKCIEWQWPNLFIPYLCQLFPHDEDEDLSRYSNKIESVSFRKCPLYRCFTYKYLESDVRITNIYQIMAGVSEWAVY